MNPFPLLMFSFVVDDVCVLKQELCSNYLLTNFTSTIASEYGILCRPIVIAKNSSKLVNVMNIIDYMHHVGLFC